MLGVVQQELTVVWSYFSHLAVVLIPLFIGGSFLVGLLGEYLPPDRIERILHRYDGGSGNIVAAGVGAVTPFCSCSTVPMVAGLLGAGAPLGLAFSFLLASPLVNELALVLLVGIFGIEIAAMYLIFTLAAAIIGGIVIGKFGLGSHVKDAHLVAPHSRNFATDGGSVSTCCETGSASYSIESRATTPNSSCGTTQSGFGCGDASNPSVTHRMRVRGAATGAKEFFIDLFPYLLLGMTVGAVIHGIVPKSIIHQIIGPENPFAVPIAAVVGAPIYVSMSAMLPIAASFTDQGIPIGTVLAFVVGSAGMSFPNLIFLNKLFDRMLLTIYSLLVVTTGIVIGLLFNLLPL